MFIIHFPSPDLLFLQLGLPFTSIQLSIKLFVHFFCYSFSIVNNISISRFFFLLVSVLWNILKSLLFLFIVTTIFILYSLTSYLTILYLFFFTPIYSTVGLVSAKSVLFAFQVTFSFLQFILVFCSYNLL